MTIAADDPTLATLRRAALEAIEVLRSVMKAAIAPKADGSPTNPNLARLAASQLLNLAARFLPRAPNAPARSPARSPVGVSAKPFSAKALSTKPLTTKPLITNRCPIIAGAPTPNLRGQSTLPHLNPLVGHQSSHAGPPRS